MLKAIAQGKNGRQTLVLGLSHRNVDELRKGVRDNFILVNGAELNLALDVIVFIGQTEQAMARELADLIGPDTQVKIDPRVTDG